MIQNNKNMTYWYGKMLINSFTVNEDAEYCQFQRVSCHPVYLISLESLKTVKMTALNDPSHEKSPDSASQEI